MSLYKQINVDNFCLVICILYQSDIILGQKGKKQLKKIVLEAVMGIAWGQILPRQVIWGAQFSRSHRHIYFVLKLCSIWINLQYKFDFSIAAENARIKKNIMKCLIFVVGCFTEATASVASMEATPQVVLDIMNYYQLLLTFILVYLLYIN